MRIPIHSGNDGLIVTPENIGNVHPDPHCHYTNKGDFLPCYCLDLCPYIKENGDTMVGLKFELGVVPSKAKGLAVFWENLATCPDVELKLTYEDILGAEIEAIAPAASITFTDDWTTVDTSKMYSLDTAGETGYIGRGDAGILVLEVVADPNGALIDDCCGGENTCQQPLLQWGLKYQSASVKRQRLNICNERGNIGGRNVCAVDEAPTDMIAAFDASVRKTELAFAFAQQAINQR